jgi:hypothetical protein
MKFSSLQLLGTLSPSPNMLFLLNIKKYAKKVKADIPFIEKFKHVETAYLIWSIFLWVAKENNWC